MYTAAWDINYQKYLVLPTERLSNGINSLQSFVLTLPKVMTDSTMASALETWRPAPEPSVSGTTIKSRSQCFVCARTTLR